MSEIKNKELIAGGAVLALGYFYLSRKTDEPGAGGGGGFAEEEKETIADVIVDELGGLGVTTPTLNIHIPGVTDDGPGGFPAGIDWPEPPQVIVDQPAEKVNIFDALKTDIMKFDVLTELIGIPTKDVVAATEITTGAFTSKKGLSVIAPLAAGQKSSVILNVLKMGFTKFLPSVIPSAPAAVSTSKKTSSVKRTSDPGRSLRIADWKAKYGTPKYTVTHRIKA